MFRTDGSPVAAAFIELRQMPSDTPTRARADAQGNYSVEVEQGQWLASATDQNEQCEMAPVSCSVSACAETVADLILESCPF
jgi:hypothetical protein